jgi:hypothetical protein
LLRISRWPLGKSEEPDDIEIAEFVQIADEACVEFAEPWESKLPLRGLLGFRNATADNFDEIAAVNGIAKKRAQG